MLIRWCGSASRVPATIAGTDNGDPIDHESFQSDRRKAFHGLALVVVKPARTPGRITLRAEAEGLEAAEIILESR